MKGQETVGPADGEHWGPTKKDLGALIGEQG